MEECLFDEVSTLDFHLLLATVVNPMPDIKSNFVEIPGANGTLDYTESFGSIYYNNRNIELSFDYIGEYEEWQEMISLLSNYLHGKKRKLVIGYDRDYYYIGRFTITPDKTDDVLGIVVIRGVMEPYKYEQEITQVIETVTSTSVEKTITLPNLRMEVIPTITVTGSVKMIFEGQTFDFSKGKYQSIVLTEGNHEARISGEGTITLEYRKGSL